MRRDEFIDVVTCTSATSQNVLPGFLQATRKLSSKHLPTFTSKPFGRLMPRSTVSRSLPIAIFQRCMMGWKECGLSLRQFGAPRRERFGQAWGAGKSKKAKGRSDRPRTQLAQRSLGEVESSITNRVSYSYS